MQLSNDANEIDDYIQNFEDCYTQIEKAKNRHEDRPKLRKTGIKHAIINAYVGTISPYCKQNSIDDLPELTEKVLNELVEYYEKE